VAAAFGVVMALGRPRGTTVGFLLAATGFVTLALCGFVVSLEDALNVLLALLIYFGLGLALGISENVVRQGERGLGSARTHARFGVCRTWCPAGAPRGSAAIRNPRRRKPWNATESAGRGS
jgi:hypothetical protein